MSYHRICLDGTTHTGNLINSVRSSLKLHDFRRPGGTSIALRWSNGNTSVKAVPSIHGSADHRRALNAVCMEVLRCSHHGVPCRFT